MKKTAGYRLRDLKRRSGYDANILPAKRPALSVADRVAKVDNVALLEMFLMLFCTCLAHTQLFCTNTCTYLVISFQLRDREEDGERLARLADQMTRQARVRVLLFGFCTRVV